jgi:hypothetical protein
MRLRMKTFIDQDSRFYKAAGITLIGAGLVFILDQWIQTGWLSLLVLPGLGLIGLVAGIQHKRMAWYIPSSLVGGLGWGGFFVLNRLLDIPNLARLGFFLICMGLGFLCIFLATWLSQRPLLAYWALVPGLIIASVGIPFVTNRINFFDFLLFPTLAVGFALLAWGSMEKLLGLIIPGCLLLGIGPGIFFAWAKTGTFNGLTETGVMLVWFAFGWGLITIASRVVSQRFIWWPLIPGGLLAVVGWGLYIGGNPENALSFIGNTGSIGLIIFGVYLLLLRRGFKG